MTLSVRDLIFIPSLYAFMFITVFDPGDVVLGLKVPLFLLCIAAGSLICLKDPSKINIPNSLIFYVLLFVSIPLFSIFIYYLKDGSEPFEGFSMLKGYLFIFLTIILVITKFDATKFLSNILLIMAICIISLFVFLLIYPEYFDLLNFVGMQTQIFYPGKRSYDGIITFQQAYFACSPMLVLAISYYFFKFRESNSHHKSYLFKLIICIIGLFLAGSRNNMFAAIFLPLALYILFSKKNISSFVIVLSTFSVFLMIFANQLLSFLDPSEYSNQSKISYIPDYIDIFSDLSNLFVGQGLGAYHKFTIFYEPYFITELTYFELIRNFGLFLGFIMLVMLIYPIYISFKLGQGYELQKHIAVGYFFYLIMNFTNPNLFSSMGILILCIVLTGIYLDHKKNYSKIYKKSSYLGN